MNVNDKEFAMLDEVVGSIYNRGIKDGSADVKMRVEGAYEKGLEDAWKCAKKVVLPSPEGGLNFDVFEKIFGECGCERVLKKYSASEAMQKIKEYEEQHKQDEHLCDRCKNSKLCELSHLKYVNTCLDFYPKTDATDMNDGSIKVGDEVRIKESNPVRDDYDYGICTRSLPNVNTIYVMRRDGSSGEENKDEWYKTGRNFPQIAEVLEQLGGDKR